MKREHASRAASSPCFLTPPLRVAWTLAGDRMIYDLPLVWRGVVIVYDQLKNRTVAMDEATWAIRWKAEHYLSLITNHVGLSWHQGGHAVDLDSGTTLDPFTAAVGYEKVTLGDKVLALDGDDRGQLIRAASYRERRDVWTYQPQGPHPTMQGLFCADERAVYFGLYDTSVMALSLADGQVLWRQADAAALPDALKGRRAGATDGFAIVHGEIVIFRFGMNVAGLSTADGRVVWSTPMQGISDCYLYDGRYYVTTSGGKYHILDPKTGAVMLSADLTKTLPADIRKRRPSVFAPMLVSETHTFVGMREGWLLAFERDTGRYVWNFRPKNGGGISHRSPGYFASANGRLYYADLSKCLYCLEEQTATDPVLIEQRRQR
jgi:glucose dehydrogenase